MTKEVEDKVVDKERRKRLGQLEGQMGGGRWDSSCFTSSALSRSTSSPVLANIGNWPPENSYTSDYTN